MAKENARRALGLGIVNPKVDALGHGEVRRAAHFLEIAQDVVPESRIGLIQVEGRVVIEGTSDGDDLGDLVGL